MRVLQVVTRRQRRGAEVFATELADALTHRGYGVTVLGLYAPPEPALEPRCADWGDLGASARRRLDWRIAAALAKRIREAEPHLVQANGSDTLKYSVLARWISRGRWPLVYRNISVASRWLRSPMHRAWNRLLIGAVDHVVSVSEASGEDIIRTYGLDRRRVTSIPRAVRVPPAVDRVRARQRLSELAPVDANARILAHVGSFTPEKNHLWLLDAFTRIRDRCPAAHLVLIGDGPLREAIEQRVAELGLGVYVHLLGVRADAGELVAAADLFVLPSLVEGIPGALLEAAAQAVPAVATDVGGVSQAVRDRRTGYLVAPGDRDGFVSEVVTLLAEPELRARLGAAARDLVREQFDLDAVVGRYETLYARLRTG